MIDTFEHSRTLPIHRPAPRGAFRKSEADLYPERSASLFFGSGRFRRIATGFACWAALVWQRLFSPNSDGFCLWGGARFGPPDLPRGGGLYLVSGAAFPDPAPSRFAWLCSFRPLDLKGSTGALIPDSDLSGFRPALSKGGAERGWAGHFGRPVGWLGSGMRFGWRVSAARLYRGSRAFRSRSRCGCLPSCPGSMS